MGSIRLAGCTALLASLRRLLFFGGRRRRVPLSDTSVAPTLTLPCRPPVLFGVPHPPLHAWPRDFDCTSSCVESGSHSTACLRRCSSTPGIGQALPGSAIGPHTRYSWKWEPRRNRPGIPPVLRGARHLPGHALAATPPCTNSCVHRGPGSIASPESCTQQPSEPGSSLVRHIPGSYRWRLDQMCPERRPGLRPKAQGTRGQPSGPSIS